jgi:hypothetical protein
MRSETDSHLCDENDCQMSNENDSHLCDENDCHKC